MDLKSLDWKSLVRSVAPAIASTFGGPLAGLGVAALSTALLGKADGSEADVAAALATATPDTLLKMKEADQQFAVEMKKLDIDLEKISAGDRDSARKREVEVKDKTPRNLAYLFTIGFFSVLGAELLIAVKGIEIAEAALRTLDVTLGVLFGMMLGVKEYYFGSSHGSAIKTEMMAGLEKRK